MTDHRDQHEPYNFTFDPPKHISDAALRISQDIAQRLNQVWRAFPDKDVRFVLVHHDEWDRCTKLTREAAEEIERLRKEKDAYKEERGELVNIANKLKCERDEARRLVCRHTKKRYRTLREMAEGRGWDCFPEPPLNRLSKLDEECGLQ